MQRHPEYTRNRIKKLTDRIKNLIYPKTRILDEILVSPVTERISYEQACQLPYRSAKLGEQFGPLWSTYWFKLKAKIPADWPAGRVDLLWDSRCEATLWIAGCSRQGLNHAKSWDGRPDAVLTHQAQPGQTLEFMVEMACNAMFGGEPKQYDHISGFVLDRADFAWYDPQAADLFYDLLVLQELENETTRKGEADLDHSWAGELLYELNRFANVFDEHDRATWEPARAILRALYAPRNATRVHELSAIGHAHMDTAWLWPLAETYRKCVRTFSSQVTYMEDYPEHKFSCSQAQQYAWIKEGNPDLYARIKARVKSGQWVPVGGTWVEPDCNIPSGESLCRQFLYGQRFFEKEFGRRCQEFWNPDVFGYNGQLPQIMRQGDVTRFLTQKLSWNWFNKPTTQTFNWQGIDGSEVLAHFPPSNTYNGNCSIAELRSSTRNYKDHDRSRHSFYLYGYGDGGGGPTKRMIEVLRRVQDLEGVPRSQIRTSDEFFTLLENDCTDRLVVIGELYFELHRGTYTTQALVKRNNRKAEFALHDAEFLAALAAQAAPGYSYPATELERLWKLVLLNQFHDILPGSSIALVYEDSARQFAEVLAGAARVCERALAKLAAPAGGPPSAAPAPVNTTSFARREVAARPDGQLALVEAPSYGIGAVVNTTEKVSAGQTADGSVTLENEHLRAVLSSNGSLLSLVEKHSGRETLSAPGNVLELYEDQPQNWDAWDVDPYHIETAKPCAPALSAKLMQTSPLRAEVQANRRIGKATDLKQIVRLDAASRRLEFHTEVDNWQEVKKFLKVAFPVNVRAMNATYEMQFGCVERPTHYNSSFDIARFEVPGHKWADLSEHGFGAALLTDCKYGYSTFGNVLRISLLRATVHPDPQADIGRHQFAYAICPHVGTWQEAGIVREGYTFNVPLVWSAGSAALKPQSFLAVNTPNLVLDTVKRAEDSDALVLRLYEAHGARGTATVQVNLPLKSAVFCNGMEDEGPPAKMLNGAIEVPYRPFQIISLKVKG